MTKTPGNDLFDALDDLLEAEREALLAGDLDKIARLLDNKETLIEELARIEELEAEHLRSLQAKIRRNQDLLDGALEGIRTVAGRLAALRRVRLTLETYDAKGSKRAIDIAQDGAFEKRA